MSKVVVHDPTQRMLHSENDGALAPLQTEAGSDRAPTEPIQARVLQLTSAHREALTGRQIARLLSLAVEDVRVATQALCERRLLRRLNTIVESYVAATPAER